MIPDTVLSRVFPEKLTVIQLVEKFPAFFWNPKFHYRIHKRSPLVSILNQTNQVPISPSYFLNIHFSIIPSTPRFPSGLFPSDLTKIRYAPLLSPIRTMSCPFHSPIRATCSTPLILLDLITQILFGDDYRS